MRMMNKLYKDRRGSTLIEVVVCVLVIGIAFVPLLMGLNTAVNANRSTEKRLYAENVATNIAEICKSYGEGGLKEFAKAEIDPDSDDDDEEGVSPAITEPSPDPDTEITPTAEPVELKKISELLEGASISASGTDKNTYYINDIKSGTGTFYAKVVFSTAAYDPEPSPDPSASPSPSPTITLGPKQNDFSDYKTVSKVEDSMPFSIPQSDYSQTIIDYFHTQAVNQSSAATIDDMANTANWLEREIIITIDKVGDDYKLTKEEIYKSSANAETGGANSKILFTSDPTPYSSTWNADAKQSVIDIKNKIPSFFIMSYGALKDNKDNKILLKRDTITVVRNVPDSISICSIAKDKPAVITLVKQGTPGAGISVTEPSGKNAVWYWSNVSVSRSNVEELPSFGGTGTGKQSYMKDVTITVYEKNTYAASDMVINKISTIIDFEKKE